MVRASTCSESRLEGVVPGIAGAGSDDEFVELREISHVIVGKARSGIILISVFIKCIRNQSKLIGINIGCAYGIQCSQWAAEYFQEWICCRKRDAHIAIALKFLESRQEIPLGLRLIQIQILE